MIAYANLFPIFHMLQKKCDCSAYEFIEGVPSDLNKKIRNGEIDISPSSSIEYLKDSGRYDLIEDHSISSKGPVKSILLFSKRPIDKLDGVRVLVSSQSETSVALLEIIIRKFYEMDCQLESASVSVEQAMRSHSAYMLIGDQALLEAVRWKQHYLYDLGQLWYEHTGLPFTFALWIVRKDRTAGGRLFEKFKSDLARSKQAALTDLRTVAAASPLRHLLSEEELVSYWQGISYDFGEEHKKGLALFRQYSKELGII
jgi:chorismate dehydratase